MHHIRTKARELMQGSCRVCPVCDGRACAGEVPGMGGLGTGASFKANVSALAATRLNMRLIHDVTEPKLTVHFLGETLSMPVMAAPVAGVAFNMGGAMPEIDYVRTVLTGCREAGVLGWFGDGAVDQVYDDGLTVLGELGGAAIPCIKPWSREPLMDKMRRAVDAGARLIGVDIDAVGLITLAKMGRPVQARSLGRLCAVIERSPALIILKGIMTPDEALMAADSGAAAIVVSNHGGRVLDHTPGTAEVLPGIAKVLKGKMPILVDGGVRNGTDVLKMLGLGADLVMLGRPLAVPAIGGGLEGVKVFWERIRAELTAAMILTGCPDAISIDSRIIA